MSLVLGIDIGTSSIKLLLTGRGEPLLIAADYPEEGADGMIRALLAALRQLAQSVPLSLIEAVGLAGQTGTYLLQDLAAPEKAGFWIAWYQAGREPYLKTALADFSQDRFYRLTGMNQPPLASYPLPTVLYLRACYPDLLGKSRLLQPKDYLCALLAGEALSDTGSWRGLVQPADGTFAPDLLAYAGITADQLPRIAPWTRIDAAGARLTGLAAGTPVAVGLNDFYAALTGMDLTEPGFCFDVTGTSEHLGVIRPTNAEGPLICSPYGDSFVHYGVTASSGISLNWAHKLFGGQEPAVSGQAPLFLPYLRGERAPVFDPLARGLFAGLTAAADGQALKYSVYEGLVFSLYEIYQVLGEPPVESIHITGGASASPLLNRLKASMWGRPVFSDQLTCGSAMGAAALAGGVWERRPQIHQPDKDLADFLHRRYQVYKRLYPAWQTIVADANPQALFGGSIGGTIWRT